MSEHRRLAVFGASGGTGAHLLPLLAERGFVVRAVARDPAAVAGAPAERVACDLFDPASVARAIEGCDGVIFLAGPRDTGPTAIYSQGGGNVLAGMRTHRVKRLVAVTALGTSKDFVLPPVMGWFARNVVGWFLRHTWADGARFEQTLAPIRDLEWTVVRPPALNHLPARGRYRRAIGEHLRWPLRLSREDLAHAVVDQLDDRATFHNWMEVAW
ncbi:MAG: NAD(P)H-binding protein [Myxococcaceae bacterium]